MVQPEPSAVLLSGVRKGVMKFEEIVQQISQQAGASVDVGVLVEYPLSRPRHTVHGSLLDKRGRKYAAPYNVRKVSVALLVGGHQRRTTTVLSAVSTHWKSWRRVRSTNISLDGCEFVRQDEQIQICELQDDGQYAGGQISDFYVLDLSGKTPGVFDLMAYAKALRESLINSGFEPEDLKFLATCGDLEWLAVRHPKYVPEPLNEGVMAVQKDEAEADIDIIENDIKYIKSELGNRQKDLLEAKDRAKPQWRWLKSFFAKPIIGDLTGLVIVIFALFASLFVFVFQATLNDLMTSTNENVLALAGGIFLVVILVGTYKYNKKALKLVKGILIKKNCIEESRDRQTEKHFQNLQKP